MRRIEAFNNYGVPLLGRRWSGVSADGQTVAVSLWDDEFTGPRGGLVYEKANTNDWIDGTAKRDFFQHLQWSVEHCRGIVRVVVVERDSLNPSRTANCYTATDIVMRVARLNPARRSFRLEQI